jgi:predicted enzyme related to lactoylglutathione lyase
MRFSAIRVFVRDLAPAKSFYADVLGLRLTHENAEHGYLTFDIDGIDLVVETVGTDAPPDEKALVGRFTGVSFAVKDIGIEYARMAAMGVAFPGLPEKQAWGGWLATFRDPSGNELQLAQYPD